MMDKVYPVWREALGSDFMGLTDVFTSAEEAEKYRDYKDHWAEPGAFYAGEQYNAVVYKTAEEAIVAHKLPKVRPVLVFCDEFDVNNISQYSYDSSALAESQDLNKVEVEWGNYFVTVLDLGSKETTLEYAQKLIKEYVDVHTF